MGMAPLTEERGRAGDEATARIVSAPRVPRTSSVERRPASPERGRLRSWLFDNLGLKLLSLVLAIFLWLVVLSEQKIETTLSLPLELKAIPRNLFLVSDVPSALRVRLRGPKTLVQNLSPREVFLDEPSSGFVEGENTLTISPDAVNVPRGIEVVGVEPQRLRIVLEGVAEREVEVFARVDGAPASGCVVQRVVVTPTRVWVAGPRSAVGRLRRLPTTPVRLDGQSGSFTTQVMLEPPGHQIRLLQETPIMVSVAIGPKSS